MAAIERYLSRGWALVPLHWIQPDGHCSCGRGVPGHVDHLGRPDYDETHDRRQGGKHPIHGKWEQHVQRSAVAWQRNATGVPNVGIATGAPSGFWVLDYDLGAAGPEADAIVARLHDAGLPSHVRTGGGGAHWYFAMPDGFEVTNRRGTLPAGLDVRGTGGQVVAPPSVSGKGAYVELPTSTDGMPYAAPEWLLDMIRPAVPLPRGEPPASWSPGPCGDDRGQRYAAAAVNDMLAELAATPNNRNDLALSKAYRLVEFINAGWVDGDAAYRAWEAATLAHPLGVVVPQSEADTLWRNALRHIGDRPAELPPEWTDPFRVDVWPAPPVTAEAVPPFSQPSPNGASTYTVPAFSEPDSGRVNGAGGAGAATANGSPSATPTDPQYAFAGLPMFDPMTEVKISEQMRLMVAREQAIERLRRQRGAGAPARLAVLRSRLLTGEQLDDVPPLVPIVDGMLYRDSLARINGLPGQGKSFLALDVGSCVATGRPWHGRDVQRAPVLYMVAEGLSGVRARKRAWEERYGPVGGDLRFYAGAEQIAGEDWEIFTTLCVELGAGLVVVDTQARATAGRNENLPADMGPVVAGLDALRVATGACVLLVHHKSKNGEGGRGTNAVEGAMQSEFDCSKTGPTVTLRTTRQKDSDASLRLALTLAPVGESAVLVLPGESGTEKMTAIEIGKMRQRSLWNFMFAFCNEGDGLSKAKIEAGMRVDPAFGTESKHHAAAFQRAWNGLIKLGLVTKHFRRDVFKVIVLEDQGDDGVLTSNGTKDGLDRWEPSGDWILWTADQDSVYKPKADSP